MKRIEQRLRESMGLDATTIGTGAIHRVIRLRMKARGAQKLEEYIELLDRSAEEREDLIEAVVVAETWFFRDRESFGALARFVKEEWLPEHVTTGVLRVLSVPCSSGEEPYSLVMALTEAGLPPERFRIDAADISLKVLERTREAVYTRNSFRGKDLSFRDRYFYTTKEGFVLDSLIRGRVSFFRGNLLSQDFPVRTLYDVIFCRNLLIYFDGPTQKKALARIERLLVSRGVLFVGPAELSLISGHGFQPLGIPMAFACRKSAGPAPLGRSWEKDKLTRRLVSPSGNAAPEPRETFLDMERLPKAAHAARNDLETARQLADAGKLSEATLVREAYLRTNSASAPGWHLLGLIREACNEPSAEECYRKALYLDPDHYETLLHLALLAEKGGNAAGARALRSRAERLRTKIFGQA